MSNFRIFLILIGLCLSAHSYPDKETIIGDALGYEKMGDYESASLEYRRLIFFYPDFADDAEFQQKLAAALSKQGKNEEALTIIETALKNERVDTLKYKLLFKKAYYAFLAGLYDNAMECISSFDTITSHTNIVQESRLLMGFCHIQKNNWFEANKTIQQYFSNDSTALSNYISWQDSIVPPRLKSMKTAKIMSIIFPGTGQAYAGYYGDAINATTVNTGTGMWFTQSILNMQWVDAGLLAFLFLRFYSSNIDNAVMHVQKGNELKLYQHRIKYYTFISSIKTKLF